MDETRETPAGIDPKGLIAESYRMDGIGAAECRSIFLDWALSVPVGADQRALARELLKRHGPLAPDHPMTAILSEATEAPARSGRRGGRAARLRSGPAGEA